MKHKKPRPSKKEYEERSKEVRALVEAHENERLAEIRKYMSERGLNAAQTLSELTNSDKESIRLEASKAFLDRTMKTFGMDKSDHGPSVVINISREQINAIKQANVAMGVEV